MSLDSARPLVPHEARRLIRAILLEGEVVFTAHALQEMKKDAISQVEVIHVLRAGTIEPAEFERGSWRYRIRANQVYAVVAFRSEVSALVVTAWRTTP